MAAINHDPAGSDQGFLPMNDGHLAFLASNEWASMLRSDLLPWLLAGGDLGDDVLEIGPGPGRTTDLLREQAARVTALELDSKLAHLLRERMAGSNVDVVEGTGAAIPWPAQSFSSVTCFHVLHHVPTASLQDEIFHEVCRVLRPGRAFLVADALDQLPTRQRHESEGETFIPLNPAALEQRLTSAGFGDIIVEIGTYQVLVRATKPAG